MPPVRRPFDQTSIPLSDMLKDIGSGEVQLPDFQRSWTWDDDHIRELLASISLSYPIGSVMLLERGGNGSRFKPRPVEGVLPEDAGEAKFLILDGQQRLTSLFLALFKNEPVPTRSDKNEPITRHYYLDIAACLDPAADRYDAVVSVPEARRIASDFGRVVARDLSTPELEYRNRHFPVSAMLDTRRNREWRREYQKIDDQRYDEYDRFEAEVLAAFDHYNIPAITLGPDTPKEAVCQVFEKVNTGGVTLTVFELMTATFAADGHNLRHDWQGEDDDSGRQHRLHGIAPLDGVDATDFLTCVTLYASYRKRHQTPGATISCKRRDVLNLELAEYQEHADIVEKGFQQAAHLLRRERVFDARNLPYQSQLVPLAAACAALGTRLHEEPVKRKLARWYWCGVFGELYGSATESRYAFDLPEIVAWVDGGPEPRTVQQASFVPTRLLGMQTRQSAAYKGVIALLIGEESRDFVSGDPIELTTYAYMDIDIHHIFPKKHCEARKYQRRKWNSIVNKAPLTSPTNREIGGHAPSRYLASIARNHDLSSERLDEILLTHAISPEVLREDMFDLFVLDRATRLLGLIERAMGKTVTGRDSDEVVQEFGGALTDTAT